METRHPGQDYYFINSTLLNSNLIYLNALSFGIYPPPEELSPGKRINLRLFDGSCSEGKLFQDCLISKGRRGRLYLPHEVMFWIRKTYPFSVAYFAANKGKEATRAERESFFKGWQKKEGKKKQTPPTVPGEAIKITWEGEGPDAPCLSLSEGFRITEENAVNYLTDQGIASVLPYIFSSVRNTAGPEARTGGAKSYIIHGTTDWLSPEEYKKTYFSHPGIYLLRRKTADGPDGYAYYVGKATDIKTRILADARGLYHIENRELYYDEVACISINLDGIKRTYGVWDKSNATPANNPPVPGGSQTDHVLYAIEDVAIHVVTMILKGGGKTLDNQQYRSYTSIWLRD